MNFSPLPHPAPALSGWVPQKTTLRLGFMCPQVLRKFSEREWGRWTERGEKLSKRMILAKLRGGEHGLIPQGTSAAGGYHSEFCTYDLRQED